MATSSTCSLRNHCVNCSLTKSLASRATAASDEIWSVTRFSCSSATLTGSTMSANSTFGASTPGITGCLVRVQQVLDHHHRVVALLERLAVEERRQLGQRQVVVVDGHRGVLLRGAELAADLVVQGGDELFGGHGA